MLFPGKLLLIMVNKLNINMMRSCLIFISLFLLPILTMAATKGNPAGFGDVAKHMMEPVGIMSDLVDTACFVLGGSFLFASIIKYFEHRRSPLMVPISTVIFLLIAGIVLILLPFVALITDHGIPFSLMK